MNKLKQNNLDFNEDDFSKFILNVFEIFSHVIHDITSLSMVS